MRKIRSRPSTRPAAEARSARPTPVRSATAPQSALVPQLFVPLLALPLTPNGKVDRRALLAAPAPEGESASESYVAPRNRVEQTLAGVWAELLRVKQVGVHDNFFSLGGDSIMVIQAAARCRRLGLSFQPRQLFQAQTVAGLAALLGAAPAAVETGPVAEFSQAGLSQGDLEELISQLG